MLRICNQSLRRRLLSRCFVETYCTLRSILLFTRRDSRLFLSVLLFSHFDLRNASSDASFTLLGAIGAIDHRP